jgi:putative flippase GtrA
MMIRAARFVAVGVAGFVVQALTLSLLTAAGLPYPVATALGVEAAILHNFFWHERWTWEGHSGTRLVRLVRFNGSTAVISIAGNVGLMWLFVGWLRLPLLLANVLAVLSLGVLNFLAADRLVFVTKLPQQQNNPTPM